jgi:S-adenosylmethionine synthetase
MVTHGEHRLTQTDYIFTSESVGAGHPDKVADQISDAILDVALRNGNESTRVACETLVTTNHVTLAGEIKNSAILTDEFVEAIVRDKIKEIGYEQDGFHWNKVKVVNLLHSQSSDIALGTDNFGAGDQGIMFGYACNDTPSYMPAPIHYAHEILKKLDIKRNDCSGILGPDCKSQVSIQYVDGKPSHVTNVVVSTQHAKGRMHDAKLLAMLSIEEELTDLITDDTKFFINPTGKFEIGGPDGDTGLTGRKIIVDTYGGYAPHGGGAFSGKDPTKVDRSAAYMARWLAKNVVASGKANWCNVQLSYAIGIKDPMAVYVDTDGNDQEILSWISTNDLTPYGIIKKFDLFNFYNYSKECVYGHFGNKDVPWEKY